MENSDQLAVRLALLAACTVAIAFASAVTSRSFARRFGIVALPSARGSHSGRVPRAVGLSVVLTAIGATFFLSSLSWAEPQAWPIWFVSSGAIVAAAGLVDDVRGVSPSVRLACHGVAAVLWLRCLYLFPIAPQYAFSGTSWLAAAVIWVVVVASVNAFNFMDGIDGLAASHAVIVTIGGAMISAAYADLWGTAICLVIASACLGFLPLNWPKASAFMGDVCSGFLGFCVAALCARTWSSVPRTSAWFVLMSPFVVDVTVTLLRRAIAREDLTSPHRQHAYQRASRLLGSHRSATLFVIAIGLLNLGLVAALLASWATPSAIVSLSLLCSVGAYCLVERAAPMDTVRLER